MLPQSPHSGGWNRSFLLIFLIVQSRKQLPRRATSIACRFSVPLSPHRFLGFLLASPETSTNFSSTWRRQRRRAEIIIGAERADYSQTMRAAGSINGFLNDHCPGEYPVYIRGGLRLLLQPRTPPGILDSLGRLLAHPPTLLTGFPPLPLSRGEDEVCSREIKHGCSRFPQRSARIHGLTRVLHSTRKRKREKVRRRRSA